MGTEYYVIDKLNKTFYDLGKGSWHLLNNDTEAFSDQEYLAHYILEEVFDYEDRQDPFYQELVDHVEMRVAKDLYEAFGKTPKDQLFIVNDCGDELYIIRSKKYKCIGTRYFDLGSEQYLNRIQLENRHFDKDRARLYDEKEACKYPEWNDW